MKPPFPAEYGLFGKPTVINNVETLAKIPYIFTHGAAAFQRFGTERSTGPKLFCLSGDVVRPGLYEVPFGVTLRHLVEDLAGGVTGGKLQAILLGGAAGGFATEKDLDVKMTFEDLRARGLPLGSGAVMVFNDKRDLRDVLRAAGPFLRARIVRQVLSVPDGHAAAVRNLAAHRRRKDSTRRCRQTHRHRLDHERRVDLRPGPIGVVGGAERHEGVAGDVCVKSEE